MVFKRFIVPPLFSYKWKLWTRSDEVIYENKYKSIHIFVAYNHVLWDKKYLDNALTRSNWSHFSYYFILVILNVE